MELALLALVAYLLGSIPFGYLLGRLKGVDVRSLGSGNIGATNVFRLLGPGFGVACSVLDTGKGFVAVLLGKLLFPELAWAHLLAAVMVLLGHSLSVFLRFRGGRSVAASLGVLIALDWRLGLGGFTFFVLLVATTRYVSVASILGALSALLLAGWFHLPGEYIGLFGVMVILIVARHKPNIERLLAGTERKFGDRSELVTSEEAPE